MLIPCISLLTGSDHGHTFDDELTTFRFLFVSSSI